jgi:hypothetical protein
MITSVLLRASEMADFIIKPHQPPPRPFAKGDTVHLIDSQGFDCGPLKVAYAGKKTVRVRDGRRYLQNDGR